MASRVNRPTLFQRTLGVFVVLACFLCLTLWLSRGFVQRQIDAVYVDTHRLAALRTFEHAIVSVRSIPDYSPPTSDEIRERFRFCAEPLARRDRKTISAADRRKNACAHLSASEELACYVRTINAKLSEMGGEGRTDRDRLLDETYVVSIQKWADAIEHAEAKPTAGAPTDSGGQENRRALTCRDAFGAAQDLAARNGRLLEQLAGRDRTARKTVSDQFTKDQTVKVSGRLLEQRNPWGGHPGCIYYGEASAEARLMFVSDRRLSNRDICGAMRPAGIEEKNLTAVFRKDDTGGIEAADTAWTLPESLDVILGDLENIRLPWKATYRDYTEEPEDRGAARAQYASAVPIRKPHGPNQLERRKRKVDIGYNVHLTIDPATQRIVQQIAACYTGDLNACKHAGLTDDARFTEFTKHMYENAAVRMAGIAVIDIPTGKIEALGSAHSDCYRQEYDGPGRNVSDCPDLPTTPHYEPDRLLNHALFTDAMPGSVVKPVMAAGFLRDPQYRRRLLADRVSGDFTRLQDELKNSDSVAFLNRMFCKDRAWQGCERARDVQQAAALAGWNLGCSDKSWHCGRLDVLFGRPSRERIRDESGRAAPGTSIMHGRLLVEPAPSTQWLDYQLVRDFSFKPQAAAACSRGAHYRGHAEKPGWRKCKGGHFVNLASEGWGQGNARATPLGVAGMLARLGAAANGQSTLRLPYLVERITDVKGERFDVADKRFHPAEPVKVDIPQEHAVHVLKGMVSHKAAGFPKGTRPGTARSACVRVFDAAECNSIDWLAGKTGTPPYGNDHLTLAAIRKKCGVRESDVPVEERHERLASCGRERPYKWYAAVFKTDDSETGYNKAIAVLTERNWHNAGPLAGKVNSPGDRGEANASAELAFRIVKLVRERR